MQNFFEHTKKNMNNNSDDLKNEKLSQDENRMVIDDGSEEQTSNSTSSSLAISDDRIFNTVVVCGYNKQRAICLPDTIMHTNKLITSIPMQQQVGSYDDYLRTQTMYKQNIVLVKCGSSHTFFLTDTNHCYACGYGRDGRLGVGQFTSRRVPTLCTPHTLFEKKIISIVTGNCHSFIINEDYELFGTGSNNHGQLCDANTVNLASFTRIQSPELIVGVKQVSCGFDFSIILTVDNKVYACGISDYG
jgi:alpha-tubulin suppressor-like RCC1 family protein